MTATSSDAGIRNANILTYLAKKQNLNCNCLVDLLTIIIETPQTSVPSTVRNLGKMQNFWANFIDFESEINITKCKIKTLTKNLNILMQDCSMYLVKANLMQKNCKRGPQSSEIFGQKFQ